MIWLIMALLWLYHEFYLGIMIGENRENHRIHDGYTLGCFNGKGHGHLTNIETLIIMTKH